MTLGTKSVLYGAHCFFLHPWFVAWAWWQLFGFPWDPRLWIAFAVHDLGYIGKPNMDGAEGERHPYFGARIMGFLFGREWYDFTLLHSRYLAKSLGRQPSRLCVADKLAIVLTPAWLYLPMVRMTGEIREHMHWTTAGLRNETLSEQNGVLTVGEKHQLLSGSEAAWYAGVRGYMSRWVAAHKSGRRDVWTDAARADSR